MIPKPGRILSLSLKPPKLEQRPTHRFDCVHFSAFRTQTRSPGCRVGKFFIPFGSGQNRGTQDGFVFLPSRNVCFKFTHVHWVLGGVLTCRELKQMGRDFMDFGTMDIREEDIDEVSLLAFLPGALDYVPPVSYEPVCAITCSRSRSPTHTNFMCSFLMIRSY